MQWLSSRAIFKTSILAYFWLLSKNARWYMNLRRLLPRWIPFKILQFLKYSSLREQSSEIFPPTQSILTSSDMTSRSIRTSHPIDLDPNYHLLNCVWQNNAWFKIYKRFFEPFFGPKFTNKSQKLTSKFAKDTSARPALRMVPLRKISFLMSILNYP